jgi:heat-inducible transcriptional repressor
MKVNIDFNAELDDRSRDVFRLIVESYLEEGEPLGSRTLSKKLPMSLSPASVRNVMADLESLGLIFSPHISAGRLPTEQGLRFFVDAFMDTGEVSETERQIIESQIKRGSDASSMEKLFTDASQMLSGMSRGAGLVLSAKREGIMKHIEFIRLEENKALAVLVWDTGDVENRVLDIPPGITASQLSEAANYLNHHGRDRSLSDARRVIDERRKAVQSEVDTVSADLIERGLAVWSGSEGGQPSQLIVRGRSNLIDSAQDKDQIDRLKLLFDELERKDEIIRMLDLTEDRLRRAHLHRVGKPVVLAVGIVAGRRALSRFKPERRRRHRHHRPDPAELRAHRPRCGLHGAAHRQDDREGVGRGPAYEPLLQVYRCLDRPALFRTCPGAKAVSRRRAGRSGAERQDLDDRPQLVEDRLVYTDLLVARAAALLRLMHRSGRQVDDTRHGLLSHPAAFLKFPGNEFDIFRSGAVIDRQGQPRIGHFRVLAVGPAAEPQVCAFDALFGVRIEGGEKRINVEMPGFYRGPIETGNVNRFPAFVLHIPAKAPEELRLGASGAVVPIIVPAAARAAAVTRIAGHVAVSSTKAVSPSSAPNGRARWTDFTRNPIARRAGIIHENGGRRTRVKFPRCPTRSRNRSLPRRLSGSAKR